MIRIQLYDSSTRRHTAGGQELLAVWHNNQDATLWIDLYGVPEDVETPILKQYFQLHPLGIEDAQRERHPPKFESFRNHSFVLMKGLDAETRDVEFGTIQIAIFFGDRFIVTRHSGPSSSIDKVWGEVGDDPERLARGPDSIAVRVAGFIVDRYLTILLSLETRLEDLEDEMLARSSDILLAELVGHRANLKKLRRILTYHVQLFEKLKAAEPPRIRDELQHELTDVCEHLERAMSLAGLYYDLASDLMDGYISLASHRLNHIVTILTAVTTVFVPLSFMAGVYGMNFDHMPELHMRYGYFIVLGVMAAIGGGLLFTLRRKQWLKNQ